MSSALTGGDEMHWVPLPEQVRAAVAASSGSILLETSRFDASNEHSYLFLKPVDVITAETLNDLPQVFRRMEEARAKGFYVAGYLSYECGYHFEQVADVKGSPDDMPLAWFGIYDERIVFDHRLGRFETDASIPPAYEQATEEVLLDADRLALVMALDEYTKNILTIKELIAAGETYQVNFTDGVFFQTSVSPFSLYRFLLQRQSVAYGAWMNVAGHHVLSFSPELFFKSDGSRIVTRPMKGTMPRGLDLSDDALTAQRLMQDEKNRSEHLMIVDLLRNDLGRICTMGSVQVEDIFSVEKFETLLQMTSTVTGKLRPGITFYEIFRGMFPSGSITGAPKIRTMQIIHELERRPRGIYTGAIGFIAPSGAAAFNVAIRTLVMKDGDVTMGVGGGIVADSDPVEEYKECEWKTSFLTSDRHRFRLVETMLWEDGFGLLSKHMDRLESSAGYFSMRVDREAIVSQLDGLSRSFARGVRLRVRLLVDAEGEVTIESFELPQEQSSGRIRLSMERICSSDVLRRHKTTRREIYDREYAAARADGFDEAIFLNENDEVAEGAISNIFVEKEGRLWTPPLASGALPGVYRRHLLEGSAGAGERVLTVDDLKAADAIFVCNAVRGMRRVELLEPPAAL